MTNQLMPELIREHHTWHIGNNKKQCIYCGAIVQREQKVPASPCVEREKWLHQRLNQSFMVDLFMSFGSTATNAGPREFTNRLAYRIYERWHSQSQYPVDDWQEMTVRNNLSAAAYRGLLVRTSPGHYKFAEHVTSENFIVQIQLAYKSWTHRTYGEDLYLYADGVWRPAPLVEWNGS